MADVFPDLESLARSEYLARIVDNCGESADRYTVVFSDGSYLAMSGSPSHPQGVSLTGEDINPQTLADWVESGAQIDLALGDLPEHLQRHILGRVNEGFADFVDSVERRDPTAVAPTREKAKVNEGIMDFLGLGIYSAGEGFCVRMDCDSAADDRGPFTTAADAVQATLPDVHAWAGEEYHSTVDVGRLTPDPDTLAKVKALEEKHDAAYSADLEARMTASFGPAPQR